MKLNTPFDQILEQLPTQRLKQVMLWYCSGTESVETHSKALQAIINEVEAMDYESCFQSLNQLNLQDLVSYSLMNEFGPSFAERPSFNYLTHQVTRNLEAQMDQEQSLEPALV